MLSRFKQEEPKSTVAAVPYRFASRQSAQIPCTINVKCSQLATTTNLTNRPAIHRRNQLNHPARTIKIPRRLLTTNVLAPDPRNPIHSTVLHLLIRLNQTVDRCSVQQRVK